MVVTNYSERQHGEPDVEVQFDYEGQLVTGFIDARRQNEGVWEAWVWFSYDDENGWRSTRKYRVAMDQLTVLSIDDVIAEGEGRSARFHDEAMTFELRPGLERLRRHAHFGLAPC